MAHPLRDYIGALEDLVPMTREAATAFARENIEKAKAALFTKIDDPRVRQAAVIANLVDLATGVPLETAETADAE